MIRLNKDNYDDDALGWAQSKGRGAEFKKVLIANGKLDEEKEPEKKPKYDSSSSSEADSSASDETDDSDKAFFEAAKKGFFLQIENLFFNLRATQKLNEIKKNLIFTQRQLGSSTKFIERP